jgi:hypothetical protein
MLKSVAYSIFVLVRDTVRHWLFFVSGALASLAGWILQARGTNLPTDYFVYAGAALMVIALIRAWHELRVERDALAADRAPKFDIVFAPKNDNDDRPYIQTLIFPVDPRRGHQKMVDRRYRVGIVSRSSATVPKVRLLLASCTPSGNYIHLEHTLLAMNTKPPSGEEDLAPSANGEPTLWFDVVNELAEEGKVPSVFFFCYSNPDISGGVSSGKFDIELRAEGGNVSVTKKFRISKSWNPTDGPGRLKMEAI